MPHTLQNAALAAALLAVAGCSEANSYKKKNNYPRPGAYYVAPKIFHKGLSYVLTDDPDNARVAVYTSAKAADILGRPRPTPQTYTAVARQFLAKQSRKCKIVGRGRPAAKDLYEFTYRCS